MATEKQRLITLRSSDLQEFSVSESAAAVSLTIKRILEDECPTGSVIPLLNVDGETLASVISYMNAHASEGEQKKFDGGEFVSEKVTGVLLVVIKAAHYLDIPWLFDLISRTIADRIKDKSVEYVRKLFGQVNDFTPEEEDEIRSQNHWVFEDVDKDEKPRSETSPPVK